MGSRAPVKLMSVRLASTAFVSSMSPSSSVLAACHRQPCLWIEQDLKIESKICLAHCIGANGL